MMQIPDVPAAVKCAACLDTPRWHYVPDDGWGGYVRDGRGLVRHDCRPRRYTPPTDLYRAMRNKIAPKEDR